MITIAQKRDAIRALDPHTYSNVGEWSEAMVSECFEAWIEKRADAVAVSRTDDATDATPRTLPEALAALAAGIRKLDAAEQELRDVQRLRAELAEAQLERADLERRLHALQN